MINEAVPCFLGKSELCRTNLLISGQVFPTFTFYIGETESVPCSGSVVKLVGGGLLLNAVQFAEFLVAKIRLGDGEDVVSGHCARGKCRDDGC